MTFSIDLEDVTEEIRHHVAKECIIKPPKTGYGDDNPKPYACFAINKNEGKMYVPMRIWHSLYDSFPTASHPQVKLKSNTAPLTEETDIPKRRDQDVVLKEAIKQLTNNRAVFLALYTSFGKTFCGTYLAAHFKRKTVVLCHSDLIKKQWPGEFMRFTNAKVQLVKGNTLDAEADVYIIGIIKASKMPREVFKDIGFVILDEAHMCAGTAFTLALTKFTPDYLLALSATPDRADGLHALYKPYFGKFVKQPLTRKKYTLDGYIGRLETKEFRVVKYETDYKPEIELVFRKGRWVPDWSLVISSLDGNEDRQSEIAQIAIDNPTQKFIILCNRQCNVYGIYNILKEKGEYVEKLVDTQKVWDRNARILVAGWRKAGVGFNDPELTAAIIASDTKDVRQFEGRLRTAGCTVFHAVDNYKTLEKHWDGCETWYREKGAVIEVHARKGVVEGLKRSSQQKIMPPEGVRLISKSKLFAN